jgi:hypothetical protein
MSPFEIGATQVAIAVNNAEIAILNCLMSLSKRAVGHFVWVLVGNPA